MSMRIVPVLTILLLLTACSRLPDDQAVDQPASGSTATESIDIWPVGPEFTASEFTQDGVVRDHPVRAQAFTNSSVSIGFGVCPYGGGADYTIVDGRFVMASFFREEMECLPEDPDLLPNAKHLEDLFLSGPSISITASEIVIYNDNTRLVLRTDNPDANQTVVPIETRYHGVSSNNPNIDPSRVSLILPAFFVLDVQLESCLAHTQIGELGGEGPRDVIVGVDPIDCPGPTTSDQAVLDLLNARPTLTYADGLLTITTPDGTNLVLE